MAGVMQDNFQGAVKAMNSATEGLGDALYEKVSGPLTGAVQLATNLINHGMPIQEVAAVLGHDKIDTTMKYVYIDQTNVENAYRKYA